MTQSYTPTLFFFFFKQHDGDSEGLFVCLQNMAVSAGVVAFVHEMSYPWRAPQREVEAML